MFRQAKSLYSADVTPGKTINNMFGRALAFDLDKSTNASITFNDYLTKILATCDTCLEQMRRETI